MLENIRYAVASWLVPEIVATQQRVEDIDADREAQGYTITELRKHIETKDARISEMGTRLGTAGLKMTVMRDALTRALPYVQDAFEDANKQVERTSMKSKNRAAVIATATAVWADVVAIKNTSNPPVEAAK